MKFLKHTPCIALIVVLISVCVWSCTTEHSTDTTSAIEEPTYVKLSLPDSKMVYTIGEHVIIKASFDTSLSFKSSEYYIDNKKIEETSARSNDSIQIKTDSLYVGSHVLSCKIIKDSQYVDIDNVSFILLSNITPAKGEYKILNVFPHDVGAYTQGLVYNKGTMYEGTGINGESKLKEVKLKTGETIREVPLASEHFGEGIALVNNHIVQLTWQSNIGFVYSVDSFKKEREFTYPTEGWGLAFDGTYLIMSNGSEYLTYLDTANYTIVKRIQVYDNNGPITKLNELECVNGYVYSNVYTTNFIVKIDPATGKVVERWELNNLLSDTDKTERTDVLNGIAYNSRNNHFFITGKYWPKLFEMKLY